MGHEKTIHFTYSSQYLQVIGSKRMSPYAIRNYAVYYGIGNTPTKRLGQKGKQVTNAKKVSTQQVFVLESAHACNDIELPT